MTLFSQSLRLQSVLLLLLLSCTTLPLSAQAAPKTGTCKISADCDDGNFCNGEETCALGQCQKAKTQPCDGRGEYCDKKTQACVLRMCTQHFMCDDKNWCNGEEICDPARGKGNFSANYSKGYWGCFAGRPRCPRDTCDETNKTCEAAPTVNRGCDVPDADGDGYAALACGGDDCDDSDPNISPGKKEVCDAQGIDEDCNPRTFGDRDADGDGIVDARCCNGENCGTDCDDKNASVGVRSTEVCNNIDDDCDGQVDEDVTLTVYQDRDKDGFGNPQRSAQKCPVGDQLKNFSINDLDCDDNDRGKNPALGNCP